MPESDRSPLPERIEVWACPECGYWRKERSTGVHVVYPGRGPGVSHALVKTTYVLVASDDKEVSDGR
jgi:hypothetical protein